MNKLHLIYIFPALLLINTSYSFGVTAKFTWTQTSNCAPAIFRFTNESSTGTGISYSWDFGLGAVIAATNNSSKEQLYSKPGQYKVKLFVTDGTSTDSTSALITIFQGPSASFTADKVYGCPPLLVNFISTSTTGGSEIVTNAWDFRNGDYAQGTSIQYTYSSTGKYDIILKVTDKNGCSSSYEAENMISVTQKPMVSFSAADTFACAPPLNVSFTNKSSGSSEMIYKWTYGNGLTSTGLSGSSIYSAIGSYDVKLRATDQFGCKDSLIKKSYITIGYKSGTLNVYDLKGNIVNTSWLCDGTYRFVYSNANLPDYTWTITDNSEKTVLSGRNAITYTVKGTGRIDIKLVYGRKAYCTDSVSTSFIKSYIKAAFTLKDNLFCSLPSQVSLVNSSLNADIIKWYISDKLISTDKNTTYAISASDMPEATYEQLYSHELNKVTLPIKLIVSNGGYCYDSVINNITVALPLARFVPDKVSGCIPLDISFSDSSKSINSIGIYKYIIGSDTVKSNDNSPVSYTFSKPGVYDVKEIVNSGICTDTSDIVKIYAGEKLALDFTVTPAEVCTGGSIHLAGDDGIYPHVGMWRFSSPGLFSLDFRNKPDTTISVYSDTLGYKSISLQADYNGCLSSITKADILKIKGPAGNFSSVFTCDSPMVYRFKANITPYTSLVWNIDTATIYDKDSVIYRFPRSGKYAVSLTAADVVSGCTITRSRIIGADSVLASFMLTDTTFCAGDSVHLDATLSKDYIRNCYNEGFLWYFGDDSPPRRTFLNTWDHVYTSRGIDTIRLIVLANNGCTDTMKKVVRIFRPQGKFVTDKTSGCIPELPVKFTNTSTDTTIVSWIWNFGDMVTDSTNSLSTTHTYTSTQNQTYYPIFTVYDAYQCYSNSSVAISLIDINGDFQASDNAICTGESVLFTPADSSLTGLFWDFGDGTTSAVTNRHKYTMPGIYSVSLTASKLGCSGTVSKANFITVEQADANFTFGDSVYNCYPKTLKFVHNTSVGSNPVEYNWRFGTHTIANTSSNEVGFTFTRPGYYDAVLTVRTLNGCTAKKIKHVTINGPVAFVSYAPTDICYNDAVAFKVDSLKNVTSWKLFYGDGSTTTAIQTSHRYTTRGKIVPSIQLTNSTCSTSLVLDTIYVAKVQASFVNKDSTLNTCLGKKLNLVNKSAYSYSWEWWVNNVKTSTDYNLSNILFGKTGSYQIKLISRDTKGCVDSIVKIFTVNPVPEFYIAGDSIMCRGITSLTMSVDNDAGSSIKWEPSTGLSSVSSFTTKASPVSTTTYTATVSNTYCSTSHIRTIRVNQPFDLSRSPLADTSIYIGERIQLVVTTSSENAKYKWSPDYNITCIKCSDPWVSPARTTVYSVEAFNDCFEITEKFNVEVIADFYLEAPSAFTPNGDSNNDLFMFESGNISDFELKIFNRWGEIVYTGNDVHQGWDGCVNGHLQNIDTYKYAVKATTIHGYQFERKGEFILLR